MGFIFEMFITSMIFSLIYTVEKIHFSIVSQGINMTTIDARPNMHWFSIC
ncbi:hypothetical protein MNBD_BACTEROID03-909 [hydrothermal vent metagenome]|uniref:Uncharacterized protein n=1 Tax=hydrothermal vent metagenome TaxID=652676 RepID=A0A3B0TGA4_9ZZZZ